MFFPPLLSLALACLSILLTVLAKLLETNLLLKISAAITVVSASLSLIEGAGESWPPVFVAAVVVAYASRGEELWS